MHGNHHAGPAPPRRTVHRSAPRLVLADWPATPEAPRSPSRNSPRTRKIQSAEATRTPFHAEISSPGSPVFRPLEHQDPQSYHAAGKHLVEAIFDPHVHLLGMDQGESTATVEHGGASGANKPAIVPPPSELVCLRLLTGHPISELKTQFTAVQLKEGLEKAFEDADFKARVEVELREEARAKRRLAKQEREKMEAEAEARRKAEARERRLRRLKAKTEEEEEADNRLILKMLEDADYSEEELRTTGLDVDGLATLNAALHAASSDNVATRLLKGAITKGSVGHRLRIRNHVVEISRAKIGHDPSSLMDVRKVIWGRAAHQDVDGEIVAVDERVLGSVELLNFSGVVASEHIRVIIENPAMVWRAGQQMNKNKATHLEVTDWVYKALRMDLPRRIVVPPQERQFSEKASMEKRVVSKQPLVGTSKDCQLAICLYGAGYSATDIRDAGFSGPVIQGVGCKRSDLLKAGFPADCTVGLRWVEVAPHEATDIREFASVKFEDMVAQKYRTFKTNQPRTLELTQRELLELQRDVAAEHGTLDWDVRIKLCKGSSAADTVSPKTSRSASPFGSRVTRTTSPLSMPTSLPQTSESATLFRPVAGRRRRFAGVEGLLHTIESGAIAPLRGSYLQKLWQKKQDGCPVQDWRVACRQELPSDAFWTHGQLRELYDMLCEKHGNNRALATQLFCEVFHAVSARRLSEKHADPEGFHLDVLGPMVERRMKEEFCVQPNGTSTTLFGRVFTGLRVGIPCDIAVYWDWPSLYQEPCAHEEEVLHKEGLKASHIWFGHKHSTVWFQTKTPRCPEVWVHGDSCFANLNLSISFLLKAHSNYLLDLAKDELDMDSVDWGQAADASAIQMQSAYRGWRSRQEKKSKGLPPANENPRGEYVRALERCKMKRKLPGNPQSFMLTLQRKGLMDGETESDICLCHELFCAVFDDVAWERKLSLQHLKWQKSWNPDLMVLLPSYTRCTELTFNYTTLGNAGCKAVCDVLRLGDDGMPSLTDLRMSYCRINDQGGMEMTRTLPHAPETLAVLEFMGNQVSPETVGALKLEAVKLHQMAEKFTRGRSAAWIKERRGREGFRIELAYHRSVEDSVQEVGGGPQAAFAREPGGFTGNLGQTLSKGEAKGKRGLLGTARRGAGDSTLRAF